MAPSSSASSPRLPSARGHTRAPGPGLPAPRPAPATAAASLTLALLRAQEPLRLVVPVVVDTSRGTTTTTSAVVLLAADLRRHLPRGASTARVRVLALHHDAWQTVCRLPGDARRATSEEALVVAGPGATRSPRVARAAALRYPRARARLYAPVPAPALVRTTRPLATAAALARGAVPGGATAGTTSATAGPGLPRTETQEYACLRLYAACSLMRICSRTVRDPAKSIV